MVNQQSVLDKQKFDGVSSKRGSEPDERALFHSLPGTPAANRASPTLFPLKSQWQRTKLYFPTSGAN